VVPTCFLAGVLPVLVGLKASRHAIAETVADMGEFVTLMIGCVVIGLFLWGLVSGWKAGPQQPAYAPRPTGPPVVYPVPGPPPAKTHPDLPRGPSRIKVVRTDHRCPACRQLLLDGEPTARCRADASHKVHRHCVAMMQGKCPQCKNQLA
jgi:hypothetical protein